MILTQPVFRFERQSHVYTLDGEVIPHVTGMLEDTGYISTVFYDDESRERGSIVHALTAEYDLGAIADPEAVVTRWKGWFLAYVAAVRVLRPIHQAIEEAFASLRYRFGGRPDRIWIYKGLECIVDIKTGGPEPWHGVQCALNDIVVGGLPPGVRLRYGLYLTERGRWTFMPHEDRRDYDKAYGVIHATCTSR